MLNLNSLLLFSEKPEELADFYKKVLQKDPDWSGGEYRGFKLGCGSLLIGPHDKVHGKNNNPERMMFNLETTDVSSEFERLKNMGVTVIQEPYSPGEDSSMTIATFADPENNIFQITTAMQA